MSLLFIKSMLENNHLYVLYSSLILRSLLKLRRASPWSNGSVLDHRSLTLFRISAWAYLKGVSSLNSLHYLCRSLGPFSLPRAQKWPQNINHHLSYACEIWGNTYKSQWHTLMLLQKRVSHPIAKASYLDLTHPLFVQYMCLKLINIVKLKTLINYNL